MNITYQYYNEIVLLFRDYEIDYRNGEIVVEVPVDSKPFDKVCGKIEEQLNRIAGTLEPRDRPITVKVLRGQETEEIILPAEESE